MKMRFDYTGDVHSFIMAMMHGDIFLLTGNNKSLLVCPTRNNYEFLSLSIVSVGKNKMKMTILVDLMAYDGEAMMSFEYEVKSVQVAEATDGHPAVMVDLFTRPTLPNDDDTFIIDLF